MRKKKVLEYAHLHDWAIYIYIDTYMYMYINIYIYNVYIYIWGCYVAVHIPAPFCSHLGFIDGIPHLGTYWPELLLLL